VEGEEGGRQAAVEQASALAFIKSLYIDADSYIDYDDNELVAVCGDTISLGMRSGKVHMFKVL